MIVEESVDSKVIQLLVNVRSSLFCKEEQLPLVQIDLLRQPFKQPNAVLLLTLNLFQLLTFRMSLGCSCLGLAYLSSRLLIGILQVLDAKLHALNSLPDVRVGRTNHVFILLDVRNREVR